MYQANIDLRCLQNEMELESKCMSVTQDVTQFRVTYDYCHRSALSPRFSLRSAQVDHEVVATE